jgi:hypothetical protein
MYVCMYAPIKHVCVFVYIYIYAYTNNFRNDYAYMIKPTKYLGKNKALSVPKFDHKGL